MLERRDTPPGETPVRETGLIGGVEKRAVVVVPYRPEWPETFRLHRERIAAAIGAGALGIDHIGSTAVPGLAAKPIVDMLVVVVDSADENAYLPTIKSAGYVLRVREPEFEEHRMFRTPGLDVHVHVLSFGSPEIERYLRFRGSTPRRSAPPCALPDAQADAGPAGLAGHERLCPGEVRTGRSDHRVVEANGSS